jgi:hypothetical protein
MPSLMNRLHSHCRHPLRPSNECSTPSRGPVAPIPQPRPRRVLTMCNPRQTVACPAALYPRRGSPVVLPIAAANCGMPARLLLAHCKPAAICGMPGRLLCAALEPAANCGMPDRLLCLHALPRPPRGQSRRRERMPRERGGRRGGEGRPRLAAAHRRMLPSPTGAPRAAAHPARCRPHRRRLSPRARARGRG